MDNSLKALVLTYKKAPIEIREKVSLNEESAKQLLTFIRNCTKATDVMVISTCNRTEIYFNSGEDISHEILHGIRQVKKIEDSLELHFELLDSPDEVVRHLFEVSIGLDAQVIGDLQVSGQVKSAYQWSADEGMAGPLLHRLMHTVFYSNKRVVQETAFRDGAASISYAAKELVEELTAGITDPSILIFGAGEIGRDFCLNLSRSRFKNVTIINRTLTKAEKMALESGFRFAPIEDLAAQLEKSDVIVTSVSGDRPFFTADLLKTPINRHKFFIDLSIPRSVDADLELIPGVEIYNLDDLKEKTSKALERRKAAIPQVHEIIEDGIHNFEDWSREMIVSPAIQKLKNALEQIRKEELARYLKHASTEEARRMEELSRTIIQKVVKLPALQLKAACKRGDAESLVEVLQELFDLERKKDQ